MSALPKATKPTALTPIAELPYLLKLAEAAVLMRMSPRQARQEVTEKIFPLEIIERGGRRWVRRTDLEAYLTGQVEAAG